MSGVRFKTPQEIARLEIVGGNTDELLPYELTHALEKHQLQFAIDQLEKYPKRWNLRKGKFNLVSIFTDYPTNHRFPGDGDTYWEEEGEE